MTRRPVFRSTEFQLLVAPSLLAIVGLLTIFLVPRGDVNWRWADVWVSLAFVGLSYGLSVSFGLLGFRGDQVLLPLAMALAGFGLLVVQRLHAPLAARDAAYANLAQRHLIYLAAGLVVLWGTVVFVRRLDWLRRYKYTWLLLSLALLGLTFFIGEETYGARLWIRLGPIQAQPSEIAKITLVTFLAGYLDDKRELVGSSWRVGPLRLPPVPYLLPMALMGAASLAVLVVQNDLGSALLFFGVFLAMLYVASGRFVYVIVGSVAFAGACWAAYRLFNRIGIRVQNWLDPWRDPLDTGYQQIQSDYALASGGLLGVGLGKGEPFRIPAVQTDFVFSAIGEELGLLGTLGVLALYLLLVMRAFAIGLRIRDGFARLVAVGLGSILGLQTLIILGGVVRLIPLTGITLPFVSYGGSSLLTNFLIVGLLLRVSAVERS
ncbi:MAG: FtsW/RodA/SpoVE family cell cycle protein [Chloroflexota bacterium]|nr:FtsW/RodA/SpoVE family cell cycle protein [Chloroflexota bacterium]